MKPHIICHMLASLDGGLHPSRYTESPDGSRAEWSGLYEQIHNDLEGDAWIVGRVTMAEMSKAGAHPPAHAGKVERPHHFARRDAGSYALALDASGKLHFAKPDIGGDHVVVLLGRDVQDSHLAELAADGVSYVVSQTPDIDLAAMLDVLGRELGIRRLLLEGGAGINGSFFAAGLVDELSLLIAPALDARAANQGFVEFGEAGLASKMQLSLTSCEALAHGLVHLRYAVSAG
ncbi:MULTISPECIES: RibD family protein [unclassified Mesorhizobium]|uniref:RibD family protein n=1 Tax=unclassified Mesorhizobium TaxID=325217 RepID=UPI000FCC2248|nr:MULTISPECIES: RibD family protein [unclassified Mesorhizobium]RUW49560.1 RibD family protein [Mesorhizobium sp. M8A.F.Ca.ET.021.01.1.1]RWC86287.1 MAG: RibD family protein [Mesorhizobium sp.]